MALAIVRSFVSCIYFVFESFSDSVKMIHKKRIPMTINEKVGFSFAAIRRAINA
jgi:hypothetical protein